MSSIVTVVDYKTSNIRSVSNMLRKIGTRAIVTSDPEQIRVAEKLILPGIGAFDAAMGNLAAPNVIEALNEAVLKKATPILGICLGMQLFAESSEEGRLPGLGWIRGKVKRFDFAGSGSTLPIPHMGWNYVRPVMTEHPLFRNVRTPMRFYFVHSYHIVCQSEMTVAAITDYGYEFTCAVSKDHIWGVQFHPEKSHRYGMQLLRNFVESA